MATNYIFQSNRLGFRNWQISDHGRFAELNSDERVMEFFPNTLSDEESAKMIERLVAIMDANGFTFFAVDLLDSNEFIGFIGIIPSNFNAFFTPCVEIGWRLKASVWNRGLATEGAKACLKYGFEVLKLEDIYSITAVINKRSERIMQKIGLSNIGTFKHPKLKMNDPLNQHVVYRISKDEYEKERNIP